MMMVMMTFQEQLVLKRLYGFVSSSGVSFLNTSDPLGGDYKGLDVAVLS